MRITEHTQYATVAPVEKYFTAETVQRLQQAAEAKFGGMYDLTFATFYACEHGDFSEPLGDMTNPTALQVYWRKRFVEFETEFAQQLKACTLPLTAEEKQANDGLLRTDWGENMLVFVQQFFGLPSFKEAEQITLGEILIAKRAAYNRDAFQRKINAIQMRKFSKK